MGLMYEGALLAVLVVWFFLRDWRATFVSATALPLSIIPTFGAMYLFGFTINVVTLLSLSLVIGILVDDAIVEIENIIRHLQMGKTPYQAAMEAADEIGLAVIATTFTLIAVFLPTAFMTGVVGKFFVQFGWTAAIAVFFSLVVARMLTPMMAAYILKPKTQGHAEARWERSTCAGRLVPEAPCGDLDRAPPSSSSACSPALRRYCPPASCRRTISRRRRSHCACRRAAPSNKPTQPREQAEALVKESSAGQGHLHNDRRRCVGQRPVRFVRRRRRHQGDADDQPDRPQGAARHQQAGGRGRFPPADGSRCPAHASRSAWAARTRSTSWRWPATTAAC
jgi:hypothetical protein